jgi:hypothetical protein
MGDMLYAYKFWLGSIKERGHLGDPGIDGRVISK